MRLRDRIRQAGFLPDMGRIQDDLNAKFGELVDRLDTMIDIQNQMLAELRTQEGPHEPPA